MTLPLWNPTPVQLGAVGYLSKPSGTFVTLFNSFDPYKSSGGTVMGMPSVYGYGRVQKGNQRQDKRNAAQRGLDAFVGLLTWRNKGDGTVSYVSFRLDCLMVLIIVPCCIGKVWGGGTRSR